MAINSTNLSKVVASIAATGLVLASAGFSSVYAYQVGIQHGYLLAGLTVLFAVALELIKPLAIHQAFSRASWSLGLLGAVAVAYSLTAELSLISSQRSDIASVRASQAFQANASRERYQRAQHELATLQHSRSVAELEPLIQGARPVCRIDISTGSRQTICTKPPALLAELGRAKRRLELEAVSLGSETASKPITVADPGSAALATYLAALGLMVAINTLAQWLTLVPVLALELGSALSLVLVASMAPVVTQPKDGPAIPAANPDGTVRDKVAQAILSHVKASGGTIRGSYRALGKMLGADRNTVGRAIHSLAGAGLLATLASKQGTVLRLIS